MDSKTELKRYNVDALLGDAYETPRGVFVKHSEALAAIEAARAVWLDIAGVPKDGTEVILRRGSRVGAAIWLKWPGSESECEGEGWSIGFDGNSWDDDQAPTHYMPLPPPPESE